MRQLPFVKVVHALAFVHLAADTSFDQAARQISGDDGLAQDRPGADRGRIVAVVGDAYQLVGEAEGGNHLGGTGQERHDAHVTTILP